MSRFWEHLAVKFACTRRHAWHGGKWKKEGKDKKSLAHMNERLLRLHLVSEKPRPGRNGGE